VQPSVRVALPLVMPTTNASAPAAAAAAGAPVPVPEPLPLPLVERSAVRLRRSRCARALAFTRTLNYLTGATPESASAAQSSALSPAAALAAPSATGGTVVGAGAPLKGHAHSPDTVALLEAEVKVGVVAKMIDPVTGGVTKPVMDLSNTMMMDSRTTSRKKCKTHSCPKWHPTLL